MDARRQRIRDLEEVVGQVEDGMTVGMSGFAYQGPPMAVVRALIRRGVRDLTLISGPTAGIETDLLIGAGCVRRVVTAGVALEQVTGIAPAFRKGAESGSLEVWECDECIWYVALQAAAWKVPYLLWPGGVGSSLPDLNADLEQVDVDGQTLLRVGAVQPDIVFIHAAAADSFGNVRGSRQAYLGRSFAERALAQACAGPVVATVEEIIDEAETLAAPERTMLFGADVVHVPWGAHPGGVSGRYVPDLPQVARYAVAAADLNRGDGSRYATYLDEFVRDLADHSAYLDAVGGGSALDHLTCHGA